MGPLPTDFYVGHFPAERSSPDGIKLRRNKCGGKKGTSGGGIRQCGWSRELSGRDETGKYLGVGLVFWGAGNLNKRQRFRFVFPKVTLVEGTQGPESISLEVRRPVGKTEQPWGSKEVKQEYLSQGFHPRVPIRGHNSVAHWLKPSSKINVPELDNNPRLEIKGYQQLILLLATYARLRTASSDAAWR
jgi:hypothetical protein